MKKYKKTYKVGKVTVYVETTPTLLNPDEAWETFDPLQGYTGTWTGPSFNKRLNLAVANYKSIPPALSKKAREWAKFTQQAGATKLVVFKTETTEIGNACIRDGEREIDFSFNSRNEEAEIAIQDGVFRLRCAAVTSRNPRNDIASLIKRIEAVKRSGVEVVYEE